MKTLKGIPVSPGIAFGEALVIDDEGFRIQNSYVCADKVPQEIERYEHAFSVAQQEIASNAGVVARELGNQYGAIFQAHMAIMEDSTLKQQITDLIQNQKYSAEYAVTETFKQYAEKFKSINNEYLSQRVGDIIDIEKRIMRILMGIHQDSLAKANRDLIVLAHNLTPSETTNLNPSYIKAFVTEIGGKGSHTAIVAEALEIPAVVGLGKFLHLVKGGQSIIVDGNSGVLIIDPNQETLEKYQQLKEKDSRERVDLEQLDNKPCRTLDGIEISLLGNIEFPFEARHCLERKADGVGLFRTEFLYMTSEITLDEDSHFNVYREVVEKMNGKPVTIRTYDLGSDKVQTDLNPDLERNPALGLRSIRLALYVPEIFRRQLRAILRATVFGPVNILFPMISTLTEWRRVKMIVHDTFEDLDEKGIPFDHNVKLGMMVEVPSAVMMIDEFVKVVDFVSIGTNDLIQYTLAADRTNKDVAPLFTGCDPSVIRLIWKTVTSTSKEEIPSCLCGQMGGDPMFTMLLLGLGLRSLSVPPGAIRDIKRVCTAVNLLECRELAFRTLRMDNANDIRSILQRELSRVLPNHYRFDD